jgi:hypothetical protein
VQAGLPVALPVMMMLAHRATIAAMLLVQSNLIGAHQRSGFRMCCQMRHRASAGVNELGNAWRARGKKNGTAKHAKHAKGSVE